MSNKNKGEKQNVEDRPGVKKGQQFLLQPRNIDRWMEGYRILWRMFT